MCAHTSKLVCSVSTETDMTIVSECVSVKPHALHQLLCMRPGTLKMEFALQVCEVKESQTRSHSSSKSGAQAPAEGLEQQLIHTHLVHHDVRPCALLC